MSNKSKQVTPQTVIRVCAKCSDLCNVQLLPGLNGEGVSEHDGYVPSWLPNSEVEHYGDYVELDIDLATGQILNWKRPTMGQLKETFGSSK